MKPKRQEDALLQRYLNEWLDNLPLLEPDEGFTDKVMQEIKGEALALPLDRPPVELSKWKRQIGHGIVATAATFLFVSTGILHRLLTIDDQITQVPTYIEKLYHLL